MAIKVGEFLNVYGSYVEVIHTQQVDYPDYDMSYTYAVVVHGNVQRPEFEVLRFKGNEASATLADHAKDYYDAGVDFEERVSRLSTPWVTVIKKWGTAAELGERVCEMNQGYRYHDSQVANWLVDKFGGGWSMARQRCGLFQPNAGESHKTISIYMSHRDFLRDRRTDLKIGRAFRHMFPELDDAKLEKFVDDYRKDMAPRTFTLHTGSTREDFRHAYTAVRCSYQNPRTTSDRKSIAQSCMHDKWRYSSLDENDISVCEAYASGDFHVAWVMSDKDQLGGRVVIGKRKTGTYSAGPIYGACEASIDMLQEYLESIKADQSMDWDGLTLLGLGYSNPEDWVVPYLDCDEIRGSLTHDGKRITLTYHQGEYEFNDTDGFMQSAHRCGCCGDHADPDTMVYVELEGEMCEHCFDQYYTFTEGGDIISQEDAITCFTLGYKNRTFEITEHIDETVYIEQLEEFWLADDCEYVESIQDYYPSHLVGDLEQEGDEELAA